MLIYLSAVSLAPQVSGQFAGSREERHKGEPVDVGNLHLDVNIPGSKTRRLTI